MVLISRTMEADQLHRLLVLAEIADAGGLAAAARRLRVAKSSVSHHVAALERAIGARVLDRTGRGVALNAIGQVLALHGRAIRAEAHAAMEAARAAEQPVGRLRVGMPSGIVDGLVVPLLTAFLQRFPGLALDIVATDAIADLAAERLDASFRLGRSEDPRFVARRMIRGADILVAAPAYLAASPAIEVPADLARHPWIVFATLGREPMFEVAAPGGARIEVRAAARVSTTSGLAIKHFALAGAGVARMPDFTIREELADGRLVDVLPGHVVGRPALYLVFPPERLRPANARRLLDFALAWFAKPEEPRVAAP